MQIPDVRLMCVVMMKHGVSGFPCPAVGTPAAGRPGAPWATGVAMEVPRGPAIDTSRAADLGGGVSPSGSPRGPPARTAA